MSNNRNIDDAVDKDSSNTLGDFVQEPSSISRIETSSLASSLERQRQRRLFIGNLSPRMTSALVEKLFQPYGSVEHVFLPNRMESCCSHSRKSLTNKRKFSGGGFYALVTMVTADEANAAIAGLHGRTLLSQRLVVQPAKYERTCKTNLSDDMMPPKAVKTISLREVHAKIQGLKEAIQEDWK
jgi:RNA recognition motif-containing protein